MHSQIAKYLVFWCLVIWCFVVALRAGGHPVELNREPHSFRLLGRAPNVVKHCMGDGCQEHYVKFTPRGYPLEATIAERSTTPKALPSAIARRARNSSSRTASGSGGSGHTQFPSGSGRDHFPPTRSSTHTSDYPYTHTPSGWTTESTSLHLSNARNHRGSTPVAKTVSADDDRGRHGGGHPNPTHVDSGPSSAASRHASAAHRAGSPTHSTESTGHSHPAGQKPPTMDKGKGKATSPPHIASKVSGISSHSSSSASHSSSSGGKVAHEIGPSGTKKH